MKLDHRLRIGSMTALLALFSAGCTGPNYATSAYQPGPAIGRGIGAGAGAIVGNAAGAVVGAGEGFVGGVVAPFNTRTHTVRRWRTEVTPDGRTIQVPEDILVDEQGRPVNPPPPKPAEANPQPTTNFGPK
jgi:hypothetical protein